MTINQDSTSWEVILRAMRLTTEEREALAAYARRLTAADLPVIFGFEHLAHLLGVEPLSLAKISSAPKHFYREFEIPKRSGGSRRISAPYPALLEIQRWIAQSTLCKLECHDSAFGFVKGRSIVDNARQHLNTRSILRVDITDFFPSINLRRVIAVFRELGYLPSVSYWLASLCVLNGTLPQGAPSSPALSNIIARRLDRRLTALAEIAQLRYSRYADDLVFSGEIVLLSTLSLICEIVESEGFRVNEKKTILATGRKKKIVTGISVSGEEPKLPRATRRKLRQELHYVQSLGVASHMTTTNQQDPLFVERLLGKFSFWQQVEPNNAYVLAAVSSLRNLQANLDERYFDNATTGSG